MQESHVKCIFGSAEKPHDNKNLMLPRVVILIQIIPKH